MLCKCIYMLTFTISKFLHLLKVKSLSRVRLSATPWTVAHQVPLSLGFSRQEYWSGLPFTHVTSVLSLIILITSSVIQRRS